MSFRHSSARRVSLHRSAGGFTLIEVLIAVLVLAVGLLGVAGLHLQGLRQSQGSLQATQATALAYSLADLMRANSGGAVAGNYVKTVAQMEALTSPTPDCGTATCSASQLAAYDLYNWYRGAGQLKDTLGSSARATITCSVAGACSARSQTIVVYWDQNRVVSGNNVTTGMLDCGVNPGSYDPTTDLACVAVSLEP